MGDLGESCSSNDGCKSKTCVGLPEAGVCREQDDGHGTNKCANFADCDSWFCNIETHRCLPTNAIAGVPGQPDDRATLDYYAHDPSYVSDGYKWTCQRATYHLGFVCHPAARS